MDFAPVPNVDRSHMAGHDTDAIGRSWQTRGKGQRLRRLTWLIVEQKPAFNRLAGSPLRGTGVQPAMARAHDRASSFPWISWKCRWNSATAARSPLFSQARRIALAAAASTVNIMPPYTHAQGNGDDPLTTLSLLMLCISGDAAQTPAAVPSPTARKAVSIAGFHGRSHRHDALAARSGLASAYPAEPEAAFVSDGADVLEGHSGRDRAAYVERLRQ